MSIDIQDYKEMLVVQRKDCVDVIDRESGCWFTTHSVQAAKWNITIWRRLSKNLVTQ